MIWFLRPPKLAEVDVKFRVIHEKISEASGRDKMAPTTVTVYNMRDHGNYATVKTTTMKH